MKKLAWVALLLMGCGGTEPEGMKKATFDAKTECAKAGGFRWKPEVAPTYWDAYIIEASGVKSKLEVDYQPDGFHYNCITDNGSIEIYYK